MKEVGITTLVERRQRGDMIQVWKTLHQKDDVEAATWFSTPNHTPAGATTRLQSNPWSLPQPGTKLDIRKYFFDKNKVLFGIHKETPNSINNYIILCAKQYIWINKFKEPDTPLSLAAFRQILKSKATECKNVAEMTKKYELADKFNHLIIIL